MGFEMVFCFSFQFGNNVFGLEGLQQFLYACTAYASLCCGLGFILGRPLFLVNIKYIFLSFSRRYFSPRWGRCRVLKNDGNALTCSFLLVSKTLEIEAPLSI